MNTNFEGITSNTDKYAIEWRNMQLKDCKVGEFEIEGNKNDENNNNIAVYSYNYR